MISKLFGNLRSNLGITGSDGANQRSFGAQENGDSRQIDSIFASSHHRGAGLAHDFPFFPGSPTQSRQNDETPPFSGRGFAMLKLKAPAPGAVIS
jgi:hypothetical protein